MRITAITGSLVLHGALMAAAFALPVALPKHVSDPVTVDLFRKKDTTPETAPTPPPPEPPKLAMREPSPHAIDRPPTEAPVPPPTEAPTPAPTTSPATEAKPAGKVDLTLHALPTGSEGVASVPDGTGTFGNTPLGSGQRKPWKMRGDAGNPLTGKVADEKEDRFPLKAVGGGEYEYKGKAFSARIGRDGRVSFDDKSIRDFKGLSGGFDITDILMRAKGDDPYRAEKGAFMHETEEMRKKMARAALKERIADSLARLPGNLDEIWHNTRHAAADRRRLLYETWRDAAASDTDVGDAGHEACVIVENYVRRFLPAGSEDAFTDDELERYNRNQRQKFYPYR